jgi:hypothetical protein
MQGLEVSGAVRHIYIYIYIYIYVIRWLKVKRIRLGSVDWIHLAHDRNHSRAHVSKILYLQIT